LTRGFDNLFQIKEGLVKDRHLITGDMIFDPAAQQLISINQGLIFFISLGGAPVMLLAVRQIIGSPPDALHRKFGPIS